VEAGAGEDLAAPALEVVPEAAPDAGPDAPVTGALGRAVALLERRFAAGELEAGMLRARAFRMLLRRGFPLAVVHAALERVTDRDAQAEGVD
jgi:hypothetical protein